MKHVVLGILMGVSLMGPVVSAAVSEGGTIVVCYPGGAVNAKDATGAMDAMLRVVERLGKWPANSFAALFTTKADECRQRMAETQPTFAITSLGLYLELRTQHHLVPLVQPTIKGRTNERYRVVVTRGKFGSLDELKGKTLGGTVLEEPVFIGKIVFGGRIEPSEFFVLKPSHQAIRALRALDQGELDAVILNEQQFAGLGSINLLHPVEAVFTSEEVPLMGVVANDTTSTAEERVRFAQALEGMCADTEGRKLCDLFGVEAFTTVVPTVFRPVEQLWSRGN